MRHLSSVVACLALAACGSKPDAPPPPTTGSAGSAAVVVAPPTAPVLEVFVNDASVAKVTAAQLATWPRLDSLLPQQNRRLGQWGTVTLKDATKSTDIQKPGDTYADMVPAIYPSAGGVSFGMFDAVELTKKGTPAMHQDGLREIRIAIADNGRGQNEDGSETVADPSKLVLAFKTPAGDSQLTGDKIVAIPRETSPGTGGKESKGWKLQTLLDAGGIKAFQKLVLSDASGTNLTLEKADFDAKLSIPFVKLNKKGALRLTVYKKQGEGWTPGGDLRALASIQVLQ
jgi:hypothetical protein